jgi:quercetin dioxygenase-like cupin family protein
MCKALCLVLLILSLSCVAQAQDPVKVDSKHYSVEFENDQVRVLRIKVGPREKSIMHKHPDAVAIFVTDATGKFTFPEGEPQELIRKAGQVLWTPATTHLPENISDKPFEVILVELKGKSMAKAKEPTAKANSASATKQ